MAPVDARVAVAVAVAVAAKVFGAVPSPVGSCHSLEVAFEVVAAYTSGSAFDPWKAHHMDVAVGPEAFA